MGAARFAEWLSQETQQFKLPAPRQAGQLKAERCRCGWLQLTGWPSATRLTVMYMLTASSVILRERTSGRGGRFTIWTGCDYDRLSKLTLAPRPPPQGAPGRAAAEGWRDPPARCSRSLLAVLEQALAPAEEADRVPGQRSTQVGLHRREPAASPAARREPRQRWG